MITSLGKWKQDWVFKDILGHTEKFEVTLNRMRSHLEGGAGKKLIVKMVHVPYVICVDVLPACMPMCYIYTWCLRRPERSIGSPTARVTDS